MSEIRIDGTLKNWNDDKGFGFIATPNAGQDIFVHVSDYPKRGGRPKIGESLSFEITLNREGKKKAVRVQRPPGRTRVVTHRNGTRNVRGAGYSIFRRLIIGVLLVVLCAAGYKQFAPRFASQAVESGVSSTPAVSQIGPWRCDGRTYCSQMTSCAEAKFFLKNCPGTQMDGDGDGVPCEQQWCTSIFSK